MERYKCKVNIDDVFITEQKKREIKDKKRF